MHKKSLTIKDLVYVGIFNHETQKKIEMKKIRNQQEISKKDSLRKKLTRYR